MNRILVAFAALAAAGWGQQQAASNPPAVEETGTVFRTDARVVICHTTVTDAEGRLITNLPKSAFTVYEDEARQDITLFRREDIPVSIGLIIDNSGSMRDKRAGVEAASLALVKASNPDDEVFIVNFSDEANLDLPAGKDFTSDIGVMQQALKRIDSRGGTAMRDAVRLAIDHVRVKGKKEKKVLVVVTDGSDNESVITQESLVRAAQQSDVLIYCIGLLGQEQPAEAARARRQLTELAATTGGMSYFPEQLSEVDGIAHQVARDVRNQYTIGYTPANSALDGKYRQIRIAVDSPGAVTVRTRKGYWASADLEQR